MPLDGVDRRSFLKTIGSAGLTTALPGTAFAASPFAGSIVEEIAQPEQGAGAKPADSARFAVVDRMKIGAIHDGTDIVSLADQRLSPQLLGSLVLHPKRHMMDRSRTG